MKNLNFNSIQSLFVPWNGNTSFFNIAEQIAKQLGWYPSDIIEDKQASSIATGHLFVEHGLDNPAVISFIDNSKSSGLLDIKKQIDILGLSYNNLIDYHLTVDREKVIAFHNRRNLNNNILYTNRLDTLDTSLRSDHFFDFIENSRPKINMKSLDEELINNISRWKRLIYSELNQQISNEDISNFFNSVIFIRALEDSTRKDENSNLLLKSLWSTDNNFTGVIDFSLRELNVNSYPHNVINKNRLKSVDKLSKNILSDIFSSFYKSRDIPYNYDFSIISKHALSRIYEKYVSILNVDESIQLNLFSNSPNPFEEINKSTGSYYTPQFIARFFTRFVNKIMPDLSKTGDVKTLEPAIGSGIFLRTLLEDIDNASFKMAFDNMTGIDKNDTACDASKLSLTLLYLVKTGEVPENVNIINTNALDYFKNKKVEYDIVLSNPPFINYGSLNVDERVKVKSFLKEYARNKYDLYLAFLKIAIDQLKEDGVGLFVLPNTFMVTDSAKLIREYLIEKCNILCVVDLSSVDYKIFEDAGIYPILLIFQKKNKKSKKTNPPKATIALVRDYVGKALTDILSGKIVDNVSYNIFQVTQDYFATKKWHLLTPAEADLKMRFRNYSILSDFMDVRTGFASGSMDAFILKKKNIPVGEEDIYVPYLSDREMDSYSTIDDTNEYFFYPYLNNKKINETILKNKFPKSLDRLKKFYNQLSNRSEVLNDRLKWWEPNRPRKPDFMLVPKIVTPHLVFTPKFSFDISGKFAVSRTPFIVIKKDSPFKPIEEDFMFYILGMLNSSISTWHLLNHASKYQNGFLMLEPEVLKNIPIVNPMDISRPVFLNFISLIKERYSYNDNSNFERIIELEKKITKFSNSFYNLNSVDIKVISGYYGDNS